MDINCYRTSNNKFFHAPPRMSDGRHFTDYRPSCDVNNSINSANNIKSSYDYRMFLTRNAEKLMEVNNKHNYAKNGSFKCKEPYEVGTMLQEHTLVNCNDKNCSTSVLNEDGLGQGRKYSNEPCGLLDPFKSPEFSLDDNKCLSTEDNFNYYPLEKLEPNRNAMPGGGEILKGGDPSVYN